MFESIFNFFLFFSLFLVHTRKEKSLDCGFLLYFVYSFVAACCILQFFLYPSEWDLTLWPFVYLFVVFVLFSRPYMGKQLNLEKLRIKNDFILVVFLYFYIVCAIIDAVSNLPLVIVSLATDMGELRSNFYANGREAVDNIIVWIARNISQYSRILAFIVFFYFISDLKKRNVGVLPLLALFVSTIVPQFFESIIIASRGMLVDLVLQAAVAYIIFRKFINKRTLKRIKIASLMMGGALSLYIARVTIERFTQHNEYENGLDSLIFYFGHSMLTFSYGVVDTIRSYAGGSYALGIPITKNLGVHFGDHFTTFIGMLYLDFGPLITLFLAILVPFIIQSIINRKKIGIAEVFIYSFYLVFLINGVFVVAFGYFISIIMALILYLLLKIFT